MAITDTGQFQIIADALGAADAALQEQLVDNTGTSMHELMLARQTVYEQTTESDFDRGNTLSQAIRSVEKGLPGKVNPLLFGIASAIDAYFIAQTGAKLRIFFRTGITWTSEFREFWRRAMKEELIVKLAHRSRGSSAWASFAADQSIVLNQTLQVRTGTAQAIGPSDITVTLTLERSDSTSATETLRIPANTAANTPFTIGKNTTYQSVTAMALAGGTNGDLVEVWVQ